MRQPVVLVSACSRQLGSQPYHAVQSKYLDAVVRGAGCMPLILPALGPQVLTAGVLELAAGVLLTGSPSNLDPIHYGAGAEAAIPPLDPARDATALPLARAVLERGIPLLAICRGFQEVNVALGGTLHRAVHTLPGHLDHRADDTTALELQYGPAHRLRLTPGGQLAQLLDRSEIVVNSLHGQGIDRLAPGLFAEAVAEDGLIEAFSAPHAPGFALGVQWHPEYRVTEHPEALLLFRAFGDACRRYEKWAARRVP